MEPELEAPCALCTRTEGIEVERIIGVYIDEQVYYYDGLDVWPLEEFLRQLYEGEVF